MFFKVIGRMLQEFLINVFLCTFVIIVLFGMSYLVINYVFVAAMTLVCIILLLFGYTWFINTKQQIEDEQTERKDQV